MNTNYHFVGCYPYPTFCLFYEENIMRPLYFFSWICIVYYVLSSSFLTLFLLKLCRLELLKERERRKEEEVEALKRSMQAGLVRLILCFFVCLNLSLTHH